MPKLTVRVLSAIDEVSPQAWDALHEGDPEATPLTRHGFLHALEASGCASPAQGWRARHLLLFRGRTLLAAAPAYLREDSDGDFARDHDLAASMMRARIPYYPKLSVTVPFTPCTGRRLLVAPGEASLRQTLLEELEALAEREGAATLQLLYASEGDAAAAAARDHAERVSIQYHWHNTQPPYASMDAFLARFPSKRRNALRREMRAPAEQGIEIRTLFGDELSRDAAAWGRRMEALHAATTDKMAWGMRWVNAAFYSRAIAELPEAVQMVVATRAGRPIAAAFNLASKERLYGRTWGCLEEHPFLHFNVCLYHSVRRCIAEGRLAFEGGAGGEHKLARGFEPSQTVATVRVSSAQIQAQLLPLLQEETAARRAQLRAYAAESPLLRPVAAAAATPPEGEAA